LEIGCGLGDLGQLVIERGYPYRGFDFSPEAIQQCRRRFPEGGFRVGDAYEAASYHPQDYNVVIALEVLEHVDDFRVMENIPPGVRIIASVPNYNDVAHLRLYQDPQRDIAERFCPYMQFLTVKAGHSSPASDGSPRTIFLFHGIRLAR
jgi:2-polyprenyl-3-methyl-5-hydroxy-6-metoxy-1,4-benzoquinol methylase